MIESISIRNLGVISNAELELGPGFTALTGETGAGKTMVLTALALLLGGRADSTAIRAGETQLQVSGTWVISDEKLSAELVALGADVDNGRLVVSRTLTADGRSRALMGGISVPISMLSQYAERLVAVHGQADQIRLRSLSAQRDALDQFGDYRAELSAYRSAYQAYRDLETRLERLRSAGLAESARLEVLREQVRAVESLDVQPNELVDLGERIERLSNVEALRVSAALAHDALSSEEGIDAIQALGAARKALETARDSKLYNLGQKLRELGSQAQEIAAEISAYLHDLEADPTQLDALQQRRADIMALERRFGKSPAELIEQLPILKSEILDLDSSDEQVEKLEVQLEAALSQVGFAAKRLTERRVEAATQLSERVSKELASLAMSASKLRVNITEADDFASHGIDRVEFLLTTFSGAEPRSLVKGASGGELSRVMLAIELVLAGSAPAPTMIFDEVDAGVGGQAALELGRRLRSLSNSTQVLVVTHLPQVAAFADAQIRVEKNSSGSVTESQVTRLERSERVVELARMLSGNPDSASALQHAQELLDSNS